MGGASVVRATPHHAETIAEQAARWKADVLVSVPAHLHGLAVLAPGALSGLRAIFSSGAPLPEATARQTAALVGTAVNEVYGSSETGGIAWRRAGTAGRTEAWTAFPGVSVQASENGTIVVDSPFAETARFAGADGIALRADGRFDLLGRADGVLKIGGSRTSTAEIERRLLEVSGVRDAVVISVDVVGPRQHELWAVVAATGLSVGDVRSALQPLVDPIALPRRFRIVDALPREDSGKLVRQRVLALFTTTGAAGTSDASSGARLGRAELIAGGLEPFQGSKSTDSHSDRAHFPEDSSYFRGHFEGFPVLPGVVQVNDLVLRRIRGRWPDLRHLRRIVALKFRSPVRPGDTVAIELTRSVGDKVAFQLRGGSGAISSGTMIFETGPGNGEAAVGDRPAARGEGE